MFCIIYGNEFLLLNYSSFCLVKHISISDGSEQPPPPPVPIPQSRRPGNRHYWEDPEGSKICKFGIDGMI